MGTALSAALAAALLFSAPGFAVAQSMGVDSPGPAQAGSVPPGYLPINPIDVCPEIFQRRYRHAPSSQGPRDSLILKTWPCQNLKFFALVDATSDMEEDRLLVLPRVTSLLHACYIADLVRSVEALPRGRFLELRFENVAIYGVLHLEDLEVSARVTFINVDFIRLNISDSVNEQPTLPDCRSASATDTQLHGTSILFARVNFLHSVQFRNTRFDGDIISSQSTFANRFDVIDSDVGGDLVLESSDFARDLVLGQNTIFRGQIVLDGVRTHKDVRLEKAELIDTFLAPVATEQLLVDGQLRTTLYRANACICSRQDGSYHVDWSKLSASGRTPELEVEMADACSAFPNLPRCPRSNGFLPALIEMNDLDVGGSLSVSDLRLGAKEAGFRPFKSSDRRFAQLEGNKADPKQQIKAESSLSRLTSTEIVLYGSTVRGNVELTHNQTSAFYITNNAIHQLAGESNEIGKLAVSRNTVETIKSLRDVFYEGLYITNNQVSNSLVLDSATFDGSLFPHRSQPTLPNLGGEQNSSSKILHVEVTHNYIGRDFAFAPFEVAPGAVRHIDLSANQVSGEMQVQLPTGEAGKAGGIAWKGNIWLTSLRVDGAVALGLTEQVRADDADRRRAVVDGNAKIQRNFRSCQHASEPDARVRVHLAGTQVTNLRWALPLVPMQPRNDGTCSTWLTWEGTGLRYDRWESGGGWPSRNYGSDTTWINEFRSWRDLYPKAPPDPLHHMANYLGSLGEQSASRSARSEAKRASFPIPAGDYGATVGNVVAQFILWPTDFGLEPERAFGLLVGVVVVGLLSYVVSMRGWREEWEIAKSRRTALAKRERLSEAIDQHLTLKQLDRDDNGRWGIRDSTQWYGQSKSYRDNLLNEYSPIPERHLAISDDLIMHISAVPGFLQYDRNRQPQDFNLLRLSIDATIPVIDLQAYSQYFPVEKRLRGLMVAQRLFGWWLLTSFLASLAVL